MVSVPRLAQLGFDIGHGAAEPVVTAAVVVHRELREPAVELATQTLLGARRDGKDLVDVPAAEGFARWAGSCSIDTGAVSRIARVRA